MDIRPDVGPLVREWVFKDPGGGQNHTFVSKKDMESINPRTSEGCPTCGRGTRETLMPYSGKPRGSLLAAPECRWRKAVEGGGN